MKGRQINIGLGFWGIAVIISLEKQLLRWYLALQSVGERGCGVTGKRLTQAEPGSCRDVGPEHPRHSCRQSWASAAVK